MPTNATVAMVLMICIRHLHEKGFSFTRARQMPESPGKLFQADMEPPHYGLPCRNYPAGEKRDQSRTGFKVASLVQPRTKFHKFINDPRQYLANPSTGEVS